MPYFVARFVNEMDQPRLKAIIASFSAKHCSHQHHNLGARVPPLKAFHWHWASEGPCAGNAVRFVFLVMSFLWRIHNLRASVVFNLLLSEKRCRSPPHISPDRSPFMRPFPSPVHHVTILLPFLSRPSRQRFYGDPTSSPGCVGLEHSKGFSPLSLTGLS
jgi:hypothetical protein